MALSCQHASIAVHKFYKNICISPKKSIGCYKEVHFFWKAYLSWLSMSKMEDFSWSYFIPRPG
jgi:hypothetical protein